VDPKLSPEPTLKTANAEIVLSLASRVRAMRAKPVVVKLGGSAMEVPDITRGTLQSVVALQSLGVPVILVHGGGKPIDRAMEAAGITPVKVQGRRFTDDATLAIVCEVLAGLNADIEQQIDELGGQAEGYRDWDDFPLSGERLMLPNLDLGAVDLGRVGFVSMVNIEELEAALTERQTIPVIPSLAVSLDDGRMLNVNADTVASAVAKAMQAEAVIFLTDTPGVMRDIRDASSLYAKLTRAECDALIREGIIAGGMIPKVEACFEALEAGAKRAMILDGREPFSLLSELMGEPAGTTITP
jgi:acetylglutamate kinase